MLKEIIRQNKIGQPRKFETPADLWAAAIAYFKWNIENPCIKKDVCKSGENVGTAIEIEIERPLTIRGFCNHASIGYSTFNDYETRENFKEYSEVIKRIKLIIEDYLITGAAIGTYKENLVSRLTGLAEKKEVEVNTTKNVIVVGGKEIEI